MLQLEIFQIVNQKSKWKQKIYVTFSIHHRKGWTVSENQQNIKVRALWSFCRLNNLNLGTICSLGIVHSLVLTSSLITFRLWRPPGGAECYILQSFEKRQLQKMI